MKQAQRGNGKLVMLIVGAVVILVLAGVYFWMSGSPMVSAPSNYNSTTTSGTSDQTGQQSGIQAGGSATVSAGDNSDAALDQESAKLDAGINALDSDQSNADAGLNDKAVPQGE